MTWARLLVVAALGAAGCGHPSKAAPRDPEPADPVEPPSPKELPVATPTTDPLPEAAPLIELTIRGCDTCPAYDLDVYPDGMVGWYGRAGVASVGARHGRLAPETLEALRAAFDDAKFLAIEDLPEQEESCDAPRTRIRFAGDDAWNDVDYPHCPAVPELSTLEDRIHELVGTSQWLSGNPPAPGGPLPDGDHLLLAYARTVCYGSCPVYDLLVFDDGTVVWTGHRHVQQGGEARTQIPAESVDALINTFETARFWEMNSEGKIPVPCPEGQFCGIEHHSCTDTSHAITTYQRNGRHRTLDDEHCDTDPALRHVESTIEQLVIGEETWIETPTVWLAYAKTCPGKSKCPVYQVQVWTNGRIVWNGEAGVGATGEHRGWIDGYRNRELANAFDEIDYLTLKVEPGKCNKPKPHTITTYRSGDQERTIDDDGCGKRKALRALYPRLEQALGLGAWIKK